MLTIRRIKKMNEENIKSLILDAKYYRQNCKKEKCFTDLSRVVIKELWDCVEKSMKSGPTLYIIWSNPDLPAESGQGNRGNSHYSSAPHQNPISCTPSPSSFNVSPMSETTRIDQISRPDGSSDQASRTQAQTQAQTLGLEDLLPFDQNPESRECHTELSDDLLQDTCQLWDFHTGVVEDMSRNSYLMWDFHTGIVENDLSQDSYQMWDFHTGVVENELSQDSYQMWDFHTGIVENNYEHLTSVGVPPGAQETLDPPGEASQQHQFSDGDSQPDNPVFDSHHLSGRTISISENASPSLTYFTRSDSPIASTIRQDLTSGNNDHSVDIPLILI